MSNSKHNNSKKPVQKKANINILIIVGVVLLLIAGFIVFNGGFNNDSNSDSDLITNTSTDSNSANNAGTSTSAPTDNAQSSGDLKINMSDITEVAKFYPYNVGETKLEVLAVKADDGSIRTAFNTCQVCYSSGRGYYKQEGSSLVCQNCGNRFTMDQVEKTRGGCNPVPIMKENKTDDGKNIVITESFIRQNQKLFASWKAE
jgi:hypothetical protein